MTTEEAIRVLEDRERCRECVHGALGIDGCKDGCDECDKAFEMAIAALRAQQEREKNEPLTLDELREMKGEPEPVYLVSEKHKSDNGWMICYGADADGYIEMNDKYFFPADVFESSVVKAYRHKPKEKST